MRPCVLFLGLLLAVVGCGEGGDTGNVGVQICIDSCKKGDVCLGTTTDCSGSCGAGDGADGCRNVAAIRSHVQMCIAGECGSSGQTYLSCLRRSPMCER